MYSIYRLFVSASKLVFGVELLIPEREGARMSTSPE